MTDQPGTNIPIRMALDQAALQQSGAGVDKIQKQFLDLKKAVGDTGAAADKSLKAVSQATRPVINDLQDVGKNVENVTSKVKQATLNVEGLRRTGGALSQLGLGGVGQVVSRAGDVGQVAKEAQTFLGALGPLAPALVAVTGGVIGFQVGLQLVERQLVTVKQALQSALDTQKTYYEFAATATTKEAEQKRANLRSTAAWQQQAVDETERALKQLEQTTKISRDVGVTLPGALGEPFRQLKAQLDEDNKALSDTNAYIGRLTGGLKSGAFWANDLAAGIENNLNKGLKAATELTKRYAEAQAKLGAELRAAGDKELERIKVEQKTNNELTSFTYEQAQARIKAIEDEKAINDKIILTRGLTNAQLDRNSDEYKKNALEMANATEANKNLNFELNNLTKALDQLPAEIAARNARVIAVQEKYENDIKNAETKGLEERANIQKKYNDKLVQIARDAADAASAALRQLEQQRADLATTLGRDQDKAVREANDKLLEDNIKAAREDEKAATDHWRRLAEIQRAAQDREFDLIANRDFAGLFMSRRQTTRDMEAANTDFTRQRQDAQTARAQQQQDEQQSFDVQRRERLIAYQQQLADAKLTYDRDIAEQRRKQAQELALAKQTAVADQTALAQKLAAESRIRNAAYTQDLRLASLYGQAFVKAHDNINAAILQRANAVISRLGGMQIATTNNNSSNTNINMPVNVTGGSNPAATAAATVSLVSSVLRQIFK